MTWYEHTPKKKRVSSKYICSECGGEMITFSGSKKVWCPECKIWLTQ